ncbi:hypothetical protein D3C85_947650 [compost metagenome]
MPSPTLFTVTVKVTCSPKFGLGLLTVFVIVKSEHVATTTFRDLVVVSSQLLVYVTVTVPGPTSDHEIVAEPSALPPPEVIVPFVTDHT